VLRPGPTYPDTSEEFDSLEEDLFFMRKHSAVLIAFGMLLLALSFAGHAAAQTRTEAAALHQAALNHSAYTLPPEKLKVAIEYTRRRTLLDFAESGWGMLEMLLLLVLGVAAWMRDTAVKLTRNWVAQCFVFVLLLSIVSTALSLPLEIYGHHLGLQYGQSVQHWGSWFGDQATTFALTYLIGGLLALLLFSIIRKSPRLWWFWFWIPTMASVVFGVFITPIFIDPLYNRFEPLAQTSPALVQRLEQVVARGGIVIPPDRMFLMKASAKVTGLNAYVTGIGASKRVVVWDTSIAKATPDEISFIFGHEMGHYVLNHIYKGIAFSGVLLLALFWLGYLGVKALLRHYGEAWRIPGQQDWAAVVVLLLVISVLSFISEPLINAFSRSQEHAADVYGQEAIHGIVVNPQATAQQAFQLLGEESLDDPTPHPFVEFWTFSHPSIASRAAFAAAYDPWARGAQPKYFKK
jgi:Zn-dependent protease with chaperone function